MTSNIKKILLATLCLFTLGSCNDYIDEQNESEILADEYYRTAVGYEGLVNSTYSSLRDVYDVPWIFMAGTDMYVEGRNTQPEGLSEYRNLSPNDTDVKNFYAVCYTAIQRCNTAVYYYDKTEKVSTLDNRLGEVRFLRAYYYFLLVQNFGGVAVVTNLIDAPILSFSRNSAEEVYSFIIDEMEAALELVPETSTQFGRVTKPAIRHFLAKVYLTRGYEEFAGDNDYAKAAEYADLAINGKTLSVTFENLFWPGNEKNAEILFSIQYDKTSMKDLTTDGTNQNYWFGPYLGGEGAKYGYPYRSYTLVPTTYLFNLFTQHDARWEGTFMNVFYERYYDFYDKHAALNTLNVKFYYPHAWEVADTTAWRAADPTHRAATKIYPYKVLSADINVWEATSGSKDNETPAVRKFDDPTASFSGSGSSTRDVFLARLGETYLIAAEAYLQNGQVDLARDRINEVRRRAAKSGHEADMAITSADVNIDFILDERARELVGEYDRWFDLKRTGKLVERNSKYNRSIRTKYFNNGINAFEGKNDNLKLLRPIPQSALDLNQDDSFQQNPAY